MARSSSAASALANATILPMAFISNIFVNLGPEPPKWLRVAADILPLKHFGTSFSAAMEPWTDPPAIQWDRLGVLTIWLVVGAVVAVWRFRWDPLPGATGRTARRGRAPAT